MKQHNDKDLTKVLQDCEALVRELRTKLKDKCDEVLTLRKDIDILQTDNDIKDYELGLLKNKITEWTQNTRRHDD
tara:strand:+ start:970 stop:1194 length:225 start_codon:yes stop_codon:yes gene_type:complete